MRVLLGALLVILIGFAAFWLQPWTLFSSVEVVEPSPQTRTDAPSQTQPESSNPAPQPQSVSPEPQPATEPIILLEGALISHEHDTSGTVKVIELPNGSRTLRIEGLETSNGPDLEVWLSDAEVVAGFDGWFLFDDGEFLSLGKLKGNVGDQNYLIPENVELDQFSSMSIWCVRFAVSFGAAELFHSQDSLTGESSRFQETLEGKGY